MIILLKKCRPHWGEEDYEIMLVFCGVFETLHNLNDEINQMSVHDSNKYCYFVVSALNMSFEGFEMDCIDIESPYDRKCAAFLAEKAIREQKLKEEKELEQARMQARMRELQDQRMDAIRKAFNIYGFSDAVPTQVIEYLNDLHSDVQLLLTIDNDPYRREKMPSLKRRLEYYSKRTELMRESMAASEATEEDHACFANILNEEFNVYNSIPGMLP